MQDDVRTVDKLINTINDTFKDSNMWLSPFIRNMIKNELNVIYISFNEPVIISAIEMWNYSKTNTRGVKEINIELDENVIYKVI